MTRLLGLLATLLVAAALVSAWFDRAGTLRGIPYALLAGTAAPAGAVILMAAGDLTGGRWVAPARPVLTGLALTLPGFAVLFALLGLDLPAVYGWTDDPGVRRAYLNEPAFIARGFIVLAIWSALAWRASRGPGRPFGAGLALVAYGITVTIAAFDWGISLDLHWTSTTYPASLAVSQVGAALAFALLLGGQTLEPRIRDDLAKLLLAATLGLVYLGFMQLLVIWSGNLPDRIDYYATRRQNGWAGVETAALIVGALGPFAILLRTRWRRGPVSARLAAALYTVGLALHFAWADLGMVPPRSLVPALVGAAAPLALWATWLAWRPRPATRLAPHG